MNSTRVLLCVNSGIVALVFLMSQAPVSAVFADAVRCDLSNYTPVPGLTATVENDVLTVAWSGTANSELRVQYVIDGGQPRIRELAVRPRNGEWAVLGENLTPEFTVQTGRRRIDFTGLTPLKELGIDIKSREVIERQGWVVFWDAPFVVPGDLRRNVDMPRTLDEIQRAQSAFKTSSCEVKTDGARLEVNFPGLTLGMFSGGLRFTH